MTELSGRGRGYLLRNVSEHGLRLDYEEAVKEGEVLSVRFHLNARTIRAQARVVWCEAIATKSDAFSIGLEFVEIADSDRAHIQRYASQAGR